MQVAALLLANETWQYHLTTHICVVISTRSQRQADVCRPIQWIAI